MSYIVFAEGLVEYQKQSKDWSIDVQSFKAEINRLLELNFKLIPACGTQEMLMVPEYEKESILKLKETLEDYKTNEGEKYNISRKISIW